MSGMRGGPYNPKSSLTNRAGSGKAFQRLIWRSKEEVAEGFLSLGRSKISGQVGKGMVLGKGCNESLMGGGKGKKKVKITEKKFYDAVTLSEETPKTL